MKENSRRISTNQTAPHEHLASIVAAHRRNAFRKPVAAHSIDAFDELSAFIAPNRADWILDSGCGTGESTRHIAAQFPAHFVVGVDRSARRLDRHSSDWPDNAQLIRGELVDLWRLLAKAPYPPARHYVLYPNPYPKKQHVRRRWHGHPVFPDLVALSPYLEIRSNWCLYLEECREALGYCGRSSELTEIPADAPELTAFERKYRRSGQTCWRLVSTTA